MYVSTVPTYMQVRRSLYAESMPRTVVVVCKYLGRQLIYGCLQAFTSHIVSCERDNSDLENQSNTGETECRFNGHFVLIGAEECAIADKIVTTNRLRELDIVDNCRTAF